MAEMTAEQAAEWGKNLSFEKVWAMFAETDRKFIESAEQIKEVGRRQAENEKLIKELSVNIGGVSRKLGKWSEEMVAASICEKINPFGYEFTECARNKRYWENGKKVAEVDCFLENGDFVMPAEVKTELTLEDVDEHLERIAKIRFIMDKRNDKRVIVGAVAAAIVPENVCVYAQKKGLYVLVQSGDSITVAEMSESFKARKWDSVQTNGT
jgi:hypothetical protein